MTLFVFQLIISLRRSTHPERTSEEMWSWLRIVASFFDEGQAQSRRLWEYWMERYTCEGIVGHSSKNGATTFSTEN
ncbi:hypothetical protein SNEBB_003348 [Seison nebaliae]|nr:hypothetical protein SNEBB_003348 [Seison nebaliae]